MLEPIVLLVDDEAPFVDTMTKRLTKRKLTVFKSYSGEEALETLKENSHIDLVILDMKMPYNGCTTFLKLKQINADVKVLIASGYAQDQQIRDMMAQGCSGFILKPFRINELSQTILDILKDY